MFNALKEKTAKILFKKKLRDIENRELSFSTAFKKSFSFFVIMPEDDKDFYAAQSVITFLDHNKKNLTVFTRDFKVSLLPPHIRSRTVDFGIDDLTKFDLPSNKLIDKLKSLRFDAVLDLNRNGAVLYSYIVNLVDSKVRIGFAKEEADKFYNLQIANDEENAEKSYNNLLNCLKMF